MTQDSIQPTSIKDQGDGVSRPKHVTETDKKINREDGVDVAKLANENKKISDTKDQTPAGQAGG